MCINLCHSQKNNRKPNGNVSTSKQKKYKEATQITEISETTAAQPTVHVFQPAINPMQMQPIYPNYGLHGGESSTSCSGLLAQVMNFAGHGLQLNSNLDQ